MATDNFSKYRDYRHKHKVFEYRDFLIEVRDNLLIIRYDFRIDNDYRFSPEWHIQLGQPLIREREPDLESPLFRNLIFNLGMIELISYWKCCCPAEVTISCGVLDEEAIEWWKELYYNGLGEFFYLNRIRADRDSFMNIATVSGQSITPSSFQPRTGILVPIGGGKDSIVTLEILRQENKVTPFLLNPRPAMERTVQIAGFSPGETLVFNRTIDPKLLELNSQGFLNGHTPFSALLAFGTLLASYLTGIPEIALSNESSANEPTIPGTKINHQYSKSLEFERAFRWYAGRYIAQGITYYSFLRPLSELQIAAIFSTLNQHHASFRSCNAGSKQDRWCGDCPKCLFTGLILAPFLEETELQNIFHKDLFNSPRLVKYFDQLTGMVKEKPFECIGTIDEVNLAVQETITRGRFSDSMLLAHYSSHQRSKGSSSLFRSHLQNDINSDHFLSSERSNELIKALHDATGH